jgi:predicted short-subunit dehydrogenase-like oxidoreductase (DUF2520 family)
MKSLSTFVSIGAGNVAIHLATELCKKGFILKQVYSRTEDSCNALTSMLNADSTTSPECISPDADFYLVTLPDHALPAILAELKVKDKLIFHTAGSIGMDVFQGRFKHYGILYPLQTFSKSRQLNISKIPFFIEGCDTETTNSILEIAEKLSDSVILSDSQTRKWLHIAAIFASNFTNFMYTSAHDLLLKENIDFKLLNPLMEETLHKAQSGNPAMGQTGPAIRGDSNTLNDHIKLLSYKPDLQKLYTFISSKIQDYYSDNQSKQLNNG